MSIFKYSYYDTPDGHDLVKKLFYTNKKVSIIGFGLASTEIILVSKPFGYLNTVYRYGQLMGPMLAATTTFCIVTHVSTNLRGKDDMLNYAIGGFSTGILTGILVKQKFLGFWMAVSMACIGAAKKHSKLNNYEFYPTFPNVRKPIYGDFRTPYNDWTLFEPRQKGWVAAEERKQ
ncbi:NADH dehydrogenase [Aphis craccivora]|uniref:NADH dehydrogenase [ubiquinone] 1 alpha subcomplex subunit 11 n=1 Tax=Aphis craccivora TaxID=307492 RepID=A0A6G0ZLQ4_APHCR|nr:NADH dehydrogenase [Aphis craccivora]